MILEIIDGNNSPITIHLEDSLFEYIKKALRDNQGIWINDSNGNQYIQIGKSLIDRSFIRIKKDA